MSPKYKGDKPRNDNVRPKIANYIQMHPGSSFSDIKSIFKLTDSTLRYHLRYLEKECQIKCDSKKRIYYPMENQVKGDLSENQRLIMNTIRKHPGITQKELASRSNLTRLTIRNNIKILIKKEMLSTVKRGKKVHYFIISPEELEEAKMMRLISKFLHDKIDEETYWNLRREFMS